MPKENEQIRQAVSVSLYADDGVPSCHSLAGHTRRRLQLGSIALVVCPVLLHTGVGNFMWEERAITPNRGGGS